MIYPCQAAFAGVAIKGIVQPFREGAVDTFLDRSHTPGTAGVTELFLGTGERPVEIEIELCDDTTFANDTAFDAYVSLVLAPLVGVNGTLTLTGTRAQTFAECTLNDFQPVGVRTTQHYGRTQRYRFRFTQLNP